MKRLIFYAVLVVVSINLYSAVIDYTFINPQSLPVFSGSMSDPNIRIVYEDPDGVYVYIEIDGVLYVANL